MQGFQYKKQQTYALQYGNITHCDEYALQYGYITNCDEHDFNI